MTARDWMVLIVGLALSVGIAWFFWRLRQASVQAVATSSGDQEAMVLVKGDYTPDFIVVQHGKSVQLNLRREETEVCPEAEDGNEAFWTDQKTNERGTTFPRAFPTKGRLWWFFEV